jgi:hypothetical protein
MSGAEFWKQVATVLIGLGCVNLFAFIGWCIRIEVRMNREQQRIDAGEKAYLEHHSRIAATEFKTTSLEHRVGVAETNVSGLQQTCQRIEGSILEVSRKLDRFFERMAEKN